MASKKEKPAPPEPKKDVVKETLSTCVKAIARNHAIADLSEAQFVKAAFDAGFSEDEGRKEYAKVKAGAYAL